MQIYKQLYDSIYRQLRHFGLNPDEWILYVSWRRGVIIQNKKDPWFCFRGILLKNKLFQLVLIDPFGPYQQKNTEAN